MCENRLVLKLVIVYYSNSVTQIEKALRYTKHHDSKIIYCIRNVKIEIARI